MIGRFVVAYVSVYSHTTHANTIRCMYFNIGVMRETDCSILCFLADSICISSIVLEFDVSICSYSFSRKLSRSFGRIVDMLMQTYTCANFNHLMVSCYALQLYI